MSSRISVFSSSSSSSSHHNNGNNGNAAAAATAYDSNGNDEKVKAEVMSDDDVPWGELVKRDKKVCFSGFFEFLAPLALKQQS